MPVWRGKNTVCPRVKGFPVVGTVRETPGDRCTARSVLEMPGVCVCWTCVMSCWDLVA